MTSWAGLALPLGHIFLLRSRRQLRTVRHLGCITTSSVNTRKGASRSSSTKTTTTKTTTTTDNNTTTSTTTMAQRLIWLDPVFSGYAKTQSSLLYRFGAKGGSEGRAAQAKWHMITSGPGLAGVPNTTGEGRREGGERESRWSIKSEISCTNVGHQATLL